MPQSCFHKGSVAAAPGTAPARCVRMGPGQVHTHSSSYIWSWSLALNTPDFQKTESAAKPTRAREQTQLTEKVSRDMDCVPLNASLKITHKTPELHQQPTLYFLSQPLSFVLAAISEQAPTTALGSISHIQSFFAFQNIFSFCKLSHWVFPSPLE